MLQRLGFLSDFVERPLVEELRSKIRAALPKKAHSTFGTGAPRKDDIGYVADWGLRVHARKDDLLSEVPRITKTGTAYADNPANS
jgi:hypothetical protein